MATLKSQGTCYLAFTIRQIYRYIDFAILPFVFFVLKSRLFPAYGIYEGYNGLTIKGLIYGIFMTVVVCINRMLDILKCWMEYAYEGISIMLVVLFLVALICFIKCNKLKNKRKFQKHDISIPDRIFLLIIGCIILYLGVYAYVTIGQICTLTGVGGRSSILLGIGGAIIIYSLISWIPYKWVREILCATIMICGILHFNSYYLSYQLDFYRQQDLVYEMKENEELLDNKQNILYLTSTEPKVEATRFYSLNSNGKEAFGDESRFIMYGIDDYIYLEEDSLQSLDMFVNLGDYQMEDYVIGKSKDIEAIIIYEDSMSLKEVLFRKVREIFKYKEYEETLYREKNLLIYTSEMPEFHQIMNNIQ